MGAAPSTCVDSLVSFAFGVGRLTLKGCAVDVKLPVAAILRGGLWSDGESLSGVLPCTLPPMWSVVQAALAEAGDLAASCSGRRRGSEPARAPGRGGASPMPIL